MVFFPPAKINLGLYVLNKREDNYHNLATILYPIPFCDILEIVQSDHFSFKSTGIKISGKEDMNLCIKAYKLLKQDFHLPPVTIHLHKLIPMGAGLGGGSSDGTYTLRGLNELFELQLSSDQLRNYALKLGSDCPFFVENISQFATGRGEILEKINVDIKGKYIYIINSGIHISTKEAFENLKIKDRSEVDLKKIVQQDISFWKENLTNDFEKNAFLKYPELKQIKEKLYQSRAIYASMSGSGSTIFGIFDEKPTNLFQNNQEIFEKTILIE